MNQTVNHKSTYTLWPKCVSDTRLLVLARKGESPLENMGNIAVYPNPAKESLFVSFINNDKVSLTFELYNSMGSLLVQKSNQQEMGTEVINVKGLSSGIYFLRIRKNVYSVVTHKIIISNEWKD